MQPTRTNRDAGDEAGGAPEPNVESGPGVGPSPFYLVQVTTGATDSSPPLHAAVLAEATGVVTMSARWYAAQY